MTEKRISFEPHIPDVRCLNSEPDVRASVRQETPRLLDREHFSLGSEEFDHFSEMLDHPRTPSNELRRLMSVVAPWD